MIKNILMVVCVILVGALLGSFLGNFVGTLFPEGAIHTLFAKHITAGLPTTHVDLKVIELTFGCLVKFNISSVVGIILAALLVKKLFA